MTGGQRCQTYGLRAEEGTGADVLRQPFHQHVLCNVTEQVKKNEHQAAKLSADFMKLDQVSPAVIGQPLTSCVSRIDEGSIP